MIIILKDKLERAIVEKHNKLALIGGMVVFGIVGYLLTGYKIDLKEFVTQLAVGLIFFAFGLLGYAFRGYFEKLVKGKNNQYNAKKLNEEVFKKLSHVIGVDYFPYFADQFGFCMYKNPSFLGEDPYHAYFIYSIRNNIDPQLLEKEFQPIEKAIPSLGIGENYLQKNYNDVYLSWMKIKQELDNINKDRKQFYRDVSDKIIKELKKCFKGTPTRFLIHKGDGWAYYQDVVQTMLPLLFKTNKVDFQTENPYESQYYLIYSGYKFLGFNKIDENTFATAEWAFRYVTNDYDIRDKNGKFGLRLYELNQTLEKFCKDIQNKVVNDIDNFM